MTERDSQSSNSDSTSVTTPKFDFDGLFKRIAASRKGADAIFRATPAELAATYSPDRTERKVR